MTRRGLFAALAGLLLVRGRAEPIKVVIDMPDRDEMAARVAAAWQRVSDTLRRHNADMEAKLAQVRAAIERRKNNPKR